MRIRTLVGLGALFAGACGGDDGGGPNGAGGSGGGGPGATENGSVACADGEDNDDDGDVDCADPDCAGLIGCAEVTADACSDEEDNDGDGAVDCEDADCAGIADCAPTTEVTASACADGSDNDGDGMADCEDDDCVGFVFCQPGASSSELDAERCSDGMDNDGDGMADCEDPGCQGFAFCSETSVDGCRDGLDNDGDGLLDCEDPDCHVAISAEFCRPARLLFVGDATNDGRNELFAVNVDGSGAPRNLSGSLAAGNVSAWEIAPDGARVGFTAQIASGRVELYAVPSAGGPAPVRISAPLQANGAVNSFTWVDADRVVYRADAFLDGQQELFSTSATSSGAFPISGSMVAGSSVHELGVVAPDRKRLAYRSDREIDNEDRIWIVSPYAATSPFNVTGGYVLEGDATNGYSFSPDSKSLLYRADQTVDGVTELYVVPLDGGGAPVTVSGTMVAGGNVAEGKWAPNGTRIAFRADKDVDGIDELYSASPNGSGISNVSGPLVAGGVVTAFAFTPSGTRIVFRADKETDDTFELFIANADGTGAVAKLSGPLVVGGNVASGFIFTPDGNSVVFRADAELDGRNEIYVVDMATLTRAKLSGMPVDMQGDVDSIVGYSPDGTRLAFIGDVDTLDRSELYVVEADGSNRTKVSGTLVTGGNVANAEWTPSLEIRPYLPAGSPCVDPSSCASISCSAGVCD